IAFSSTSVLTKAASADPAERAVVEALARGEDAVRASGVDWTILRPTLIYAEGQDGNVSRLASLARRLPALPIAGRGEGRRQPVHADDLAQAALQALDARATAGRTYELAGGETLTYRQMCERVFEGLGRTPRIVSVPPALWRLGLTLASPLLPGATGEMGARMDRDLVFDDGAARADFGWSPGPFRPRF
ncbi:sugar nucleotide-binding protein, partial [Brevundimonas sp.]|uniref:sugar nucleotide-binding protein n=1 Tax=Brevundimonas sp. TaxID=1871086 RepID=UPI0025CD39F0